MKATTTKSLPSPPPAEPDALEDRERAAAARVEALRAESIVAAAEGLSFDHAALRDAEDTLTALTAALGERARKDRAAEADAADARRKLALRNISQLEGERRAAIESAEANALAMVDALVEAEDRRSQLCAALAAVHAQQPSGLGRFGFQKRVSWGLSAALTKLSGFAGGGRYGDLELHLGPGAAAPWLDREAATTAQLSALVEGRSE